MGFKSIIIAASIAMLAAGPGLLHAQENVKETEQLDFAQGLLSRGMYDMAISQYQKFISDYPNSPSLPEAYLSLGEGYFLSQDFDKAVSTFNQFKQRYPTSGQLPVSLLRLGQINIQQKKYDEAIKQLTSIDVEKQLKGAMLQSFYFYMAKAYMGSSDNASALAFFQKAADVEGASAYTALAYKEIGKIQGSTGHYLESINAYNKAMSLAGDDALKGELIYRMAETQFLSGQYNDAIKGFEQVTDQYPNLGFGQQALANMLLAYFNLGQYDQLLTVYQQKAGQIKDANMYVPTHFAAAMAYIELKRYDEANALLDKMLALPSLSAHEKARIFIKKADIMIRQKKYADGLALVEAYAPENIDNTDENFFLKAQAHYGLGDFDRAFGFFENVYLNFPNSRYAKASLLGQAHARKGAGRFKEAEVLFAKYYAVEDQPDLKSEALYDSVMMAAKAGDIGALTNSAQEYLKTFPQGAQYSKVLFMLADFYGKSNKVQDAVSLLQGYLASSPQRPNTGYFLLGFNLQLLGKNDDALAAYGQVDQQKEGGEFYFAALKNMAIICLNEKKEDQARTYFDRLISQADQNDLQLKTYIWVSNEYLKQQKYTDVLRITDQALKHFPGQDLVEIKYFQGEALRGLGRCDEAVKDYGLVTASAQKDAYTGSSHIGSGLCLEKDQKYDEAKQEFMKPLNENADDYTVTVHARFEMANLEVAQGNVDGALKLYMLIATIYDNEYYCSQSLLRAAQILERQQHKPEALKIYSEILDKYKNSAAAADAKERVGSLK